MGKLYRVALVCVAGLVLAVAVFLMVNGSGAGPSEAELTSRTRRAGSEGLGLLEDSKSSAKTEAPPATKGRPGLAPTQEEYEKKWQEAIASIRDPEVCPMYKGLKIAVVEGLYPIGQDPQSKLWEFVHLRTGGIPGRGKDGRLRITEETGLVLVLIPGGKFRMGSEQPSDDKPEGSLNVDPEAPVGPVHEVTLSAFLIFLTGQSVSFRAVS